MENTVSLIIRRVFEKYKALDTGKVADYIPELAKVAPDTFGICIFSTDGYHYMVGDCDVSFTIQSISKAFTFGMILDEHGIEKVDQRIGVEPSGEAFNSISLEKDTGRPFNPMINAGAITATGMVQGEGIEDRFEKIRSRFSRFAARELEVDEDIYRSESETGFRNRAIAYLLRNFEMLDDPVQESVEVYFKQCSILVNCRDLAVMAASLANGGINPLTSERVLKAHNVEKVLSVMSSCGMYDYSGEWIFKVGLPAKSGVGGGVMGVLPGQLGIAVFSPRLDQKGNSVRGVKAFTEISREFNLHLFNHPVISDQVIRRVYLLSEAGSQCQRPMAHHDIIIDHGHFVTVFELQGDLFFSSLERIVRSSTHYAEETKILVLDLNRVGVIDVATGRLLISIAKQFKATDRRLIIVDPGGFLNRVKFAELKGVVSFSDDIDSALESCEDTIIAEHTENSLVAGEVPFHDFDVFRFLTSSELSEIQGLLETEEHVAGTRVIAQGGDPSEIYFLAKGSVSIYLQASEATDRGRRLLTFSAGACFGDLAVIDGTSRSADVWADEDIRCYTLSIDSLKKLEQKNPVIYAKLIRNFLLMNMDRLRRSNREISSLKS